MTDAPRDDALTDAGKPVALAECPIGLFRCGDALCLKTEYGNNEGRIDAYIVSSGEFFWGDAPQTIASQRAQLVQPIELRRHRAPSAPQPQEGKIKYWLDCEFEENGVTIKLISIGLVAEDGRQYYAEDASYDRSRATPWLKANVLPLLDGPVKSRDDIKHDLIKFCGRSPEFWGWYGSYDWVCLCQIFGTMMELPPHWPMFIHEAMQFRAADSVIPARTSAEHHALSDAIWQRDVWYSLNALSLPEPPK